MEILNGDAAIGGVVDPAGNLRPGHARPGAVSSDGLARHANLLAKLFGCFGPRCHPVAEFHGTRTNQNGSDLSTTLVLC